MTYFFTVIASESVTIPRCTEASLMPLFSTFEHIRLRKLGIATRLIEAVRDDDLDEHVISPSEAPDFELDMTIFCIKDVGTR